MERLTEILFAAIVFILLVTLDRTGTVHRSFGLTRRNRRPHE